jgi:UDP-N-acetylglucosamine--N-acetylmuramyl-(pentapeptide) pyrophosphoryl-undecaprenol N-acetylglucosamine transferase
VIGYYIHHRGNGHRTRALSICARLGLPVTALTSIAMQETHVFEHVIALPRDDDTDLIDNPTADGALHWAPLHHNGLRDRMRLIAEWIGANRPAAMVVDVSIEVATLARLLGVPVIVVAMPGTRTDTPHELVYRLADHILAGWPMELYEPAWLRPHRHKTSYVGGISRFDGRDRSTPPDHAVPRVLVLGGAGDIDMAAVHRCADRFPRFQWTALGVQGAPWSNDLWPDLVAADIVVTHAGEGSVADVAAAGRPAVVIPQPRPFDEQHATAAVLGRAGMAVTQRHWPPVDRWEDLIDAARRSDPRRWRRWRTAAAADRAAAVIERVAAGATSTVP